MVVGRCGSAASGIEGGLPAKGETRVPRARLVPNSGDWSLEVDWWGTKDQAMCLAVEGPWSPTKLVALQASVALAKEALVPAPGGNVASSSK